MNWRKDFGKIGSKKAIVVFVVIKGRDDVGAN